jgi:hypothetical protein
VSTQVRRYMVVFTTAPQVEEERNVRYPQKAPRLNTWGRKRRNGILYLPRGTPDFTASSLDLPFASVLSRSGSLQGTLAGALLPLAVDHARPTRDSLRVLTRYSLTVALLIVSPGSLLGHILRIFPQLCRQFRVLGGGSNPSSWHHQCHISLVSHP